MVETLDFDGWDLIIIFIYFFVAHCKSPFRKYNAFLGVSPVLTFGVVAKLLNTELKLLLFLVTKL